MQDLTLSHDTPTEYRAYGKMQAHEQHGRLCQLRFDIYGGNDLERAPADCHLDVEMSWESHKSAKSRGVSRSASVKLDLSEMMELYAMLGEAIERAQKEQKADADAYLEEAIAEHDAAVRRAGVV